MSELFLISSNIINSWRCVVNKKLLLTLGKDIYQRYLRKITKSNSHDIEVRNNLELMYQDIILNIISYETGVKPLF